MKVFYFRKINSIGTLKFWLFHEVSNVNNTNSRNKNKI